MARLPAEAVDNQQLTKLLDKSRANLTFILCKCRNCIYSSNLTFIYKINPTFIYKIIVNNFTKKNLQLAHTGARLYVWIKE